MGFIDFLMRKPEPPSGAVIEDNTAKLTGPVKKGFLVGPGALVLILASGYVFVMVQRSRAPRGAYAYHSEGSIDTGIGRTGEPRVTAEATTVGDLGGGDPNGAAPDGYAWYKGRLVKVENAPSAPLAFGAARPEDPAIAERRRLELERRERAAYAPIGSTPGGEPSQAQPNAQQNPLAAALMAGLTGAPMPSIPGFNASPQPAPAPIISTAQSDRKPDDFSAEPGTLNRWIGPRYRVLRGTKVFCLLESAINSEIPGDVECLVNRDVNTFDGEHKVIPQGTRMFGETGRVEMQEQHRLGIAFKWMQIPTAGFPAEVALADVAQDEKGNGVSGKANNHTARLFATSVAMSLIGAGSEIGALGPLNGGGVDALRYGFAAGMSNAGMQRLSAMGYRLPTITVPKGQQIEVMMLDDKDLPAVENWRIDKHL